MFIYTNIILLKIKTLVQLSEILIKRLAIKYPFMSMFLTINTTSIKIKQTLKIKSKSKQFYSFEHDREIIFMLNTLKSSKNKSQIYRHRYTNESRFYIVQIIEHFRKSFQKMKAQAPQNSVANFVQKTFEILNNNQYAKIVQWNANGKQFTIKDIQQFQETILPKYFRHRNINSFIRQLNMYGFHKSRKEPTKNIFSHPNFIKDRMDLLQKVKRKIKLQELSNQKIQQKIEEQIMKEDENYTPMKSETPIASVTSIPIKSSISIDRESDPLKNLISKSFFINDLNPQVCLKMRQNWHGHDDDDDNISIAVQIVNERQTLQNRTQGISIVKTLNFMSDFDL